MEHLERFRDIPAEQVRQKSRAGDASLELDEFFRETCGLSRAESSLRCSVIGTAFFGLPAETVNLHAPTGHHRGSEAFRARRRRGRKPTRDKS